MDLIKVGCPLEQHVEELVNTCHHVPWTDGTLVTCFWSGLDD